MNETVSFDVFVPICTNVSVREDGVVEGMEELQLHLITEDTAIILVEPFVAEVIIIDSDGEIA